MFSAHSSSMMRAALGAAFFTLTFGVFDRVVAFDMSRNDNLAVYWGQDGAGQQQSLANYCQDNTVDTFPLAFLYIFRGAGGEPVIDFGNICSQWDNSVFPGTSLADCSFLAQDIKTCQAAGKILTLSLGGGTGQVGFSSDSQAQTFADQIWNQFLGGQSNIRPFGDAILDGIDLDIESGTSAHYAAFVNRIRSNAGLTGLTAATFDEARANATIHTKVTSHHKTADQDKDSKDKDSMPVVDVTNANKYYYITAAPQCPYPDAYIGGALNATHFDAVYVQFYNNYCSLNQPSSYNFATWDNWAKTVSPNKSVKVYIGAPGSPAAADGYVGASQVAGYVSDAQQKWSSFGGVMMWDMDTAYTNNRFDKAVKTAMVASGARFAPKQAHRDDATHKTTKSTTEETSEDKPRTKSRFFRL